jgi:hypothetical protein
MNKNKLSCPEYLKYWSADGVAENLYGDNNGIADKTYAHIWNVIVPQMETDRKKSLEKIGYKSINEYFENVGGDDGTLREMTEMQKYWHLLTDEMKEFLISWAAVEEKKFDAFLNHEDWGES